MFMPYFFSKIVSFVKVEILFWLYFCAPKYQEQYKCSLYYIKHFNLLSRRFVFWTHFFQKYSSTFIKIFRLMRAFHNKMLIKSMSKFTPS